jgi:hypothetical protein
MRADAPDQHQRCSNRYAAAAAAAGGFEVVEAGADSDMVTDQSVAGAADIGAVADASQEDSGKAAHAAAAAGGGGGGDGQGEEAGGCDGDGYACGDPLDRLLQLAEVAAAQQARSVKRWVASNEIWTSDDGLTIWPKVSALVANGCAGG